MKILLINPPLIWSESRRGEGIVPPLGLLYIASQLRVHGYNDVELLDARALCFNREEIKKEVIKKRPDIVGITSMTINADIAYKIALDIKQELPDVPMIYGGSHVSAIPLIVLEECKAIDYAVIKEGDFTIIKLLDVIKKGEGIENVQGIVYRKKDKIIMTDIRKPVADIDSLPFPARDLLQWDKYSRIVHSSLFSKKTSKRFTGIITSRGCPFGCVYCDKSVFGRNWRARSAENVIAEIVEVVKKYGVGDISFHDDLFTFDKERVFKICDGIQENGLDISWSASARVDTVNKEMLERMHKAGCDSIFFGFETGDSQILDNIHKQTTLLQMEKAAKLCKEAGICVIGSFMFGLPGETRETARKTLEFAKKINCDIAHFNITTPFPGSSLYSQLKNKNRILIYDWGKYNLHGQNAIFKHENMSAEEIAEITTQAYKEYYLRLGYILPRLKNFINNPFDFMRAGTSLLKIISHRAA